MLSVSRGWGWQIGRFLVAGSFFLSSACGGDAVPQPKPPEQSSSPTPNPSPSIARPNVILFIADDLGWRDLRFAGSAFYETPNIDRLASESIVFNVAYSASPTCSPSRAALITGLSPAKIGMTTVINDPGIAGPTQLAPPPSITNLPLELPTIAEMFRSAGYRTMFSGKWHLGMSAPFFANSQGFEVNVGGSSLGNPNGNPPNAWFSPYNNPALTNGPEGEFLEKRLTDETVRFIRENRNSRFFITHSFYLPHLPMVRLEPHFAAYQAKNLALSRPFPRGRVIRYGAISQAIQAVPEYGSMVQSMDDQVGRILSELVAQGLDDNTIVVFTSDNGGYAPEFGGTSNEPLRGGKTWLYEGGIRVPLLIRMAGSRRGDRTDYPAIGNDVLPTILGLVQIPYTGTFSEGIDLFDNERPSGRDLFWHSPHYYNTGSRPHGAVRSGDWKLIHWFEENEYELFDLSTDPGERNDLSLQRPDIVQQLKDKLTVWRQFTGARMPTSNISGA